MLKKIILKQILFFGKIAIVGGILKGVSVRCCRGAPGRHAAGEEQRLTHPGPLVGTHVRGARAAQSAVGAEDVRDGGGAHCAPQPAHLRGAIEIVIASVLAAYVRDLPVCVRVRERE
jgi:hypothetical protein